MIKSEVSAVFCAVAISLCCTLFPHTHSLAAVYTMSPELIRGDYDSKADVWSLGVIAFMLLSSSMPFFGKDRMQVIKRIIKGKYAFTSRRWRQVSADAREFVTELLQVDPNLRPSADKAQSLLWLSRQFDVHGYAPEVDMMDNVQAALQAFGEYGTLKKLALMVIAYKSTSEEIGFLRSMFHKFDILKNGEITLEEFREAMHERYSYSDEEIEHIFQGMDLDGTGKVHYCEFLGATIEAHGFIDEERLAEAFDRIDCDDTGYITVSNLQSFLGDDIPVSYLEEVIAEADITHDHRISYEEFLELWNEEGDMLLKEAKNKVRSRRKESARSIASSIGSLTESEHGQVTSVGSDVASGTSFYAMQKAQSVRGDWV